MHDSLGVAADLERSIADHVDRYEDEWAATLRDPEKLRRFRSFVNAPESPDTDLKYVLERGQIRPATEQERDSADLVLIGPTIPVREELRDYAAGDSLTPGVAVQEIGA